MQDGVLRNGQQVRERNRHRPDARHAGNVGNQATRIHVTKRFLDFGMEPMPGTPEQFRAFARSEAKRWGPIIRDNGITLD